jgi:hypothetical protein
MLYDPDVLDGVGATVARWFVNGLSRAAARVADAPARG